MKKIITSALALLLCVGLSGCGGSTDKDQNSKTLKIGATSSPHAVILKEAEKYMKEKGYTLEVVEFTDWKALDPSTSDNSLDANFFQHQPYLDGYNSDAGYASGKDGYLVSVGAVHFEPLGIYADDPAGKTSISADYLADGDKIAVPNDATNEARALLLLEKYGIIKLKEGAGINATIKDIESKAKDIELYELEAAQIPTKLKDVKFAVVNGNYALDANIIDKQICAEEKDDEAAQIYANVIAVKEENKDNEAVLALVEILKSEEIKQFIDATFSGVVVPAK
ncbi:MAG: metal ABC transporter substrate-binding protein [Erysipelotrichaceae bacterium]|nr:metal ABC transporter substrate-binding protein [Erysipelotrichaceae bacterium]